jgi:predicted small lipoprotein YifL
MNRTEVAGPSLAILLLAIALAGCMAGPRNTPQADRVQDRAMTGQTE